MSAVIALLTGALATRAHAAVSFTCASTVDQTTCDTLNGQVSGFYDSTFSNVSAKVYINYGDTGLGESTSGFTNIISYDAYRSDLIASGGGGLVRAAAIASLPAVEPSIYNGAGVEVTSALGAALGIDGLYGTTIAGAACVVGSPACYNGIITVSDQPGLLYYRSGTESGSQYDYDSVVEHELDEILGTASCISTTGGGLSNGCTGSVSAADLFRYGANGARVLVDSTPGAQFSFDGGLSNGANGFVYNTAPNGDDYADFVSQCPQKLSIQSATGCPGRDHGLDITNDGGAEINILDAVGYDLVSVQSAAPEPRTWTLMLAGVGVLGAALRSRAAPRSRPRSVA